MTDTITYNYNNGDQKDLFGYTVSFKRIETPAEEVTEQVTDIIEISKEEIAALNSIQAKIKEVNVRCGWYDKPRTFGEGIALIHSEISEALEGGRKGIMDDHLPHRKMVDVEFADAIIRILDEGTRQNCDIAEALAEKFIYNQSRADHKPENREKEGGKKF